MSEVELPKWANRQAALALGMLQKVADKATEGEPADRTLRLILGDKKKYGSRDRRFFGDVVFTWFRWHGVVGELPLPQGLCVAWYMDGTPWHDAIRAILRDLKWPEPESLSPDAPLQTRKESAESIFSLTLPEISAWVPDWVEPETRHLGPLEDRIWELISRPPTWLRVDENQQKELHEALLADGAVWAGERSPCAYAFENRGKVNDWMQKHPDSLEIQDLASQQVVRICAPKKGSSWWDPCCGAGGKSLQMLDMAERDMDLTCTDRREHILQEISRRGRKHGLARVRRYALDLLKDPELPNIMFDGILMDAPCSGAGTWARSPDTLWRMSGKDVQQMSRRQLKLLEAVLPTLKSGGHLVYAVCSLLYAETHAVIDAFLREHPEFSLVPTPHPLTGEATDGKITITPAQSNGDGMFVAKLMKT
ncbi:MAG: RsmB/NOP family class I SAM-dependent RNA methyltransferase [Verrucomicrobia bacterium]|nr:RsmB/NOP family class I SAM-dependent RNA methyltransferase [Verrucomicrobiota bacterium]MCH8513285.1 RsmB/NOP family class I SAM-dependent RNA methyltransferase [Kiritimatiellia bacterium]